MPAGIVETIVAPIAKELSKAVIEVASKLETKIPLYNQLKTIETQSLEGLKYSNQELYKQVEGKETFYPKTYEDLEQNGYKVYREEDLTHGKGENSHVKPGDGIAVKENEIIVLEIKSPKEVFPNTLADGSSLKNDYLEKTRLDVNERVKNGELSKEVGKHEIFLAQSEYNAFNFKDGITGMKEGNIPLDGKDIKVGYSVPKEEMNSVVEALKNKGITDYKVYTGDNSTITFVYDLPAKKPS